MWKFWGSRLHYCRNSNSDKSRWVWLLLRKQDWWERLLRAVGICFFCWCYCLNGIVTAVNTGFSRNNSLNIIVRYEKNTWEIVYCKIIVFSQAAVCACSILLINFLGKVLLTLFLIMWTYVFLQINKKGGILWQWLFTSLGFWIQCCSTFYSA